MSFPWLLLLTLLILYNDHSSPSPIFCAAFASIGSGSGITSNTNNINSVGTYSGTGTGNGIPDPPPPITQSKKQRIIEHRDPNTPLPITVLSGFLGSGKTTLLQNILNNSNGSRIAVIVNDVASINIDSKLVRRSGASTGAGTTSSNTSSDGSDSTSTDSYNAPTNAAAAGIVELQNGCACCSKSDELLISVADMVTLNDLRDPNEQFDHIVIELSGVANPSSIRTIFHDAMFYQMPLMDRVVLDTMITVVDCSTVMNYMRSTATANRMESPELFEATNKNSDIDPISDATDDLMSMFGMNAVSDDDDSSNNEGVAELIVSQIEISDIILLNKVDLLQTEQDLLNTVTEITYTLNPNANHIPAVYANVPIQSVLGAAKGQGVVQAGILDDHKDAVRFALQSSSSSTTTIEQEQHTSHDHDHHNHDHTIDESCNDPNCSDPSHAHSHSHHDHGATESCTDPTCTDPTHSHSSSGHHHDHAEGESCDDPECTDPTHSHSSSTTSSAGQLQAGISSFVYQARRPFHPQRLYTFLRHLPVQRGLPDTSDATVDTYTSQPQQALAIPTRTQRMMQQIIRSKGFLWCANSNIAALYWSQAGTNIDISCLGSWWATLPRSEWPNEAIDAVLQDFDSVDHIEHNIDDITSISTVGDRRQELVFIGTMVGTKSYQNDITNVLNQCLLNDTEYNLYCQSRSDEATLSKLFPSTLPVKVVR